MTPAIRTDKLTKCFTRQRRLLDLASRRNHQEILAVDGISLEVKPGEIFGLLGPNGAGKTTLIKLLCTLLLPSSGEASIYGHDVVQEAHTVRQLVGLVTCEERSFFWRLTGRQNLQFFAALYQLPQPQAASRIAELFQLLDLTEVGDIRFNEYSTGMRQKLAIARGLLSHPKILFLDEPTKGLDPISAQVLLSLIRQRVVDSLGSTIILTSHILRDIEQLCDRVGMLYKGKLIACGSLEELRFVSRQHEQYRMKVRGLSEDSFRTLERVPGVVKCRKLSQDDGVSEIAISIHKDETALSEALKYMLHRRCNILSCVLEEEKLEEVFTNLLQEVATPALRGGPAGT